MFGLGKIFRGLQLPPQISAVVAKLPAPGSTPVDQRKAFSSILLATAAHVSHKPSFNFELEMNDLWTRLTNLRNEPELRLNPTAGIGGLLHQAIDNKQLFDGIHKALEGLLKPKP